MSSGFRVRDLPPALGNRELRRQLVAKPVAVFLDYDGTLTPIVARPELAQPLPSTRAVLEDLTEVCLVGIISGRDLDDVRTIVGVDGLWYAGSHGFDVLAPDGTRSERDDGGTLLDSLESAADELERTVAAVPEAWVERKRFAIAVHFRQVDDALIPDLEAAVDDVVGTHAVLRKTGGKRIFELRPDVEWDKGAALWSLFERAGLHTATALPVYLGDDETDEDAFAAVADSGVGILVAEDHEDRVTSASYRLRDPDEVRVFLADLAGRLSRGT
ncbi:MAG: trehalose-phosphatase [Acidimicrobiia bacterium]